MRGTGKRRQRYGGRPLLCLIVTAAIGAQCANARDVDVRMWTGTDWSSKDKKHSIVVPANTISVAWDRERMGDPSDPRSKAADALERERKQMYQTPFLVKKADLLYGEYVSDNRPTEICYCTGYTLLMAEQWLEEGEVPPLRGGGDVLYPMAERFGYEITDPDKLEPGDIVFYYKETNARNDPFHVAYVVDSDGTVVTKDGVERVYRMSHGCSLLNSFAGVGWCEGATGVLYYRIPWKDIKLKVVAGTCEIDPNTISAPTGDIWTGDIVDVGFDVKVPNAASTEMVVTGLAMLVDPTGKAPSSLARMPIRAECPDGESGLLLGRAKIQLKPSHPGQSQLILRVDAEQKSAEVEPMAYYDSGSLTIPVKVRSRPKLRAVVVETEPETVYERKPHSVIIDYGITNLPAVVTGDPFVLVRDLKHTRYDESYTAVDTVVSLTNTIRSGFVDSWTNVLAVGRTGEAFVDVTLRLSHPELPEEITFKPAKLYEYTILSP